MEYESVSPRAFRPGFIEIGVSISLPGQVGVALLKHLGGVERLLGGEGAARGDVALPVRPLVEDAEAAVELLGTNERFRRRLPGWPQLFEVVELGEEPGDDAILAIEDQAAALTDLVGLIALELHFFGVVVDEWVVGRVLLDADIPVADEGVQLGTGHRKP
ncbi:MAG TPA: hypothetical protein VFW96_19610 [Thermomicrobiales bacterium]|nr:hypothetical protein [Thermomicrobiales bacterium]